LSTCNSLYAAILSYGKSQALSCYEGVVGICGQRRERVGVVLGLVGKYSSASQTDPAGLILVTGAKAAPDNQIGLQGFLTLKGSNPRISDWSIAATSFSSFPLFSNVYRR